MNRRLILFGIWLVSVLTIVFAGGTIPGTSQIDGPIGTTVEGPFARALPPEQPEGPWFTLCEILVYWLGFRPSSAGAVAWCLVGVSFAGAVLLAYQPSLRRAERRFARGAVMAIYWTSPAFAALLSLLFLYVLI